MFGGVAQLGERLICIQEVVGSIPISSTKKNKGVALLFYIVNMLNEKILIKFLNIDILI